MQKYLLILVLFLGATALLQAQPVSSQRSELENERKSIQEEMKQIQSAIDKVKGQKTQSLSQLNMLKRKMALQEKYISNINNELKLIDDEIYLSNLEIYRLQKQLDTLKSEYARTIVYSYKNRSSFDYVNFVFSSISFNDALRRIAYLKSYRTYREKQVETINETQSLIAKRQQQQLAKKDQKNKTLESRTKEREELDVQKKEKDVVVSKLKSQENDLQKQIAAKKKRDREIQNAIAAVIRREIEAAKAAEKEAAAAKAAAAKAAAAKATADKPVTITTPATTTTTPTKTNTPVIAKVEAPAEKPVSYLELNAADVKLGADFSENKGKLPWPVDNGFVKIPFGKYTIDELKIVGDNPGLTIGTPVGSAVKAVFDGVVLAIHNYGDGAAVVIRHGKYFTSYSNLSGVSVTKGATIKRGQVIGRAGEADDASGGMVDFMVMVETNNVNPTVWLRR